MCRDSFEECNQVLVHRQAQGKQARDRRADAALVGCLNVLESLSLCEIGEAACNLTSTEMHLNEANPVVPRAVVASPKACSDLCK